LEVLVLLLLEVLTQLLELLIGLTPLRAELLALLQQLRNNLGGLALPLLYRSHLLLSVLALLKSLHDLIFLRFQLLGNLLNLVRLLLSLLQNMLRLLHTLLRCLQILDLCNSALLLAYRHGRMSNQVLKLTNSGIDILIPPEHKILCDGLSALLQGIFRCFHLVHLLLYRVTF
jgi:hypothetical protein